MRKFLCVLALLLCVSASAEATGRRVLVVEQQRRAVVVQRQAVVVQRNVVVKQVAPTVVIQNRGLFRGFFFGPRVTVIR